MKKLNEGQQMRGKGVIIFVTGAQTSVLFHYRAPDTEQQHSKSFVWNSFQKLNENEVRFKLYQVKLATGRSTTTMVNCNFREGIFLCKYTGTFLNYNIG